MMSDVGLFGTLNTQIDSTGLYVMLEVQSTVTLSDTSTFDFTFDGFMAEDGDSFAFLSAIDFDFGSGLNFDDWFDMSRGSFDVMGLFAGFGWSVSLMDNVIDPNMMSYLSLDLIDNRVGNTPVSAPATLALFDLALLLMGWLNRRHTKLRAQVA
jgi:hypothetical protein